MTDSFFRLAILFTLRGYNTATVLPAVGTWAHPEPFRDGSPTYLGRTGRR